MLGRLTSTPSGTRASYVLVTMLSAAKSLPSAATVCSNVTSFQLGRSMSIGLQPITGAAAGVRRVSGILARVSSSRGV
jgi:hypothetical protein